MNGLFKDENDENGKNGKKKNMTKSEEINSQFKLPILYNSGKKEINSNIIADIELVKTLDDVENSIYEHIFNPTTNNGKMILSEFAKYYTTDLNYLKDTQKLLKTYIPKMINGDAKMNEIWYEIKGETSFCEKYLYIDWEFAKFLNNNEGFMQIMGFYNIMSPVLTLLMPIFILIVPLFILKLKGVTLSINEYVSVLKILAKNHSVCKMVTQYSNSNNSQKMYLIASAGLYLFSIYQSILTCIKFHSNITRIHTYFEHIKTYIYNTIDSMDYFLKSSASLVSYSEFNKSVEHYKLYLETYYKQVKTISPLKCSVAGLIKKAPQIGHILKTFYQLHNSVECNNAFLFSFGFNGFIDNLSGLIENINKKHINFAKFTTKTKNTKFIKSYYPPLMKTKHVKNTCKLNKNIIITGPNASGKTTVLKTTLINVIMSQQFGCGCYLTAILSPFEHIHCYLNIPDTSGRDSLFQAEARRCKDILDCIKTFPKENHFCVFDELYSGTNPEEAVIGTSAFMEYLVSYKNIKSILTTHYVALCENLTKNNNVENYSMRTVNNEYTYILEKGISKVKGGLKILSDMDYPAEIMTKTLNYSF